MWLLVEQKPDDKGNIALVAQSEIAESEVKRVRDCFLFANSYATVKIAQDIAMRNGRVLQQHMEPANLLKYQRDEKTDNAAIVANQHVLNYATSIKTFIDVTERQLRLTRSEQDLQQYQAAQSHLYDKHVEYRFWMRLRNYVVHCGFPYTQVTASADGVKVLCSKKRLLEYNKWNQVKHDIEAMGEYIELDKMIYEMNVCLMALRLEFVGIYADEITAATRIYGSFCREYSVERPLFVEVAKREDFGHGHFSFNPLPVKSLQEAVKDLQHNPHIKLNII